MINTYVVSLLIFAYATLIPASAEAYLLPLIGAGGAIITMLIGLITALFSAIYLVFYNIRRSLKKRFKGEPPDAANEVTDNTKAP